jgi:hypothetical protein
MRMMKRTHEDSRALEGFPLKLMIVLLLVSISFPVFINTYHHFTYALSTEAIEAEMERVESAAISVFLGGPGSIRTVELHLAKGSEAQTATIEIGGKCGTAQARCLRYQVGEISGTKFIQDLPIDITSPDGDPIIIAAPGAKLVLECLHNETGSWIEARFLS